MFEITGKYTNAKVMIDDVEQECVAQIVQMVNHPAFTNPIAIMPDTHAGKGSVIGFTMEIGDKIIPNIVGVDIGCGMLSFCAGSSLFAEITKRHLDSQIRKVIPFGQNYRKETASFTFNWNHINERIRKFAMEFARRYNTSVPFVRMDDRFFEDMCKRVGAKYDTVMKSIGTLGGGNHFIEVGKSENDGHYWITIHSGSRNFGKCVAEYWQKRAVVVMSTPAESKNDYIIRVQREFPKSQWQSKISEYIAQSGTGVPKGMEYLTGEDMYGYMVDMMIAQEYASLNRKVMKAEICNIIGMDNVEGIETVHNFIDFQDWIIRKGSIRSYEGERMVIPFNPKDGLLFCEGKTNGEWNNSAPHGAGRVLSRSAAKNKISKEDAEKAMEGVFASVKPLDESPLAYKSANVIEEAITPTATIIDRIIPVMNMKSEG